MHEYLVSIIQTVLLSSYTDTLDGLESITIFADAHLLFLDKNTIRLLFHEIMETSNC